MDTESVENAKSVVNDPLCEAPPDWVFHSFPLPSADCEEVSLDWITRLAQELLECARRSGDETHFAPVLHWAHLLKAAQSAAGDWPARFNARTGKAVGDARTRTPAALLAQLGEWLQSTEFDEAVARAQITN